MKALAASRLPFRSGEDPAILAQCQMSLSTRRDRR